MKKILLLGAGGFIGSHLTVALMKTRRFALTALDITRKKLDEGIRGAADVLSKKDRRSGADDVGMKSLVDQISYVDLDISIIEHYLENRPMSCVCSRM